MPLLCRPLRWLILLGSAAAATLAAQDRPNVIFIFIDDQGYYDLGCYGATEIETPHIDRMATEGIRFTDYYAAAPICSPSRAGLLTGSYPRRVGNHIWVHRADSPSGIHPDEVTMGELFQSAGYRTACIGKWHLGFTETFLPKNQGFDSYFGLLHNLDPVEIMYFDDVGGVPLMRGDEVVKRPADPAELTRIYTDEAIKFIEADRDEPFFLYLPHTMLHNPLGVSAEFKGSSNWAEYGDAILKSEIHGIGKQFIHYINAALSAIERLQNLATDNSSRPPDHRGPCNEGIIFLHHHEKRVLNHILRLSSISQHPIGIDFKSFAILECLFHDGVS